MTIPFTVEQFFEIFRLYNEGVWPVQFLLFGLAITIIFLLVFKRRSAGLGISLILTFLWAWIAFAYHFVYFTRINPLAYGFAAISLVGSGVFFWHGAVRQRLQFEVTNSVRAYVGTTLIIFSLVIYPAWSILAGHTYPAMPTFGLPCPTTIFTIGVLAFLKAPYPRSLYIVPVLWSIIGGQAAFFLKMLPDLGLIAAGISGAILLTCRQQCRTKAIL